MKEVVEVFHPLVMVVKTRMAKDPETSGVALKANFYFQ